MSTWPRSTVLTKRYDKGKQRARQVGNGGQAGVILPLDVVPNGVYDVAYTLSVLVGPDKQNLSLQVDTGSSDLWIASTSCSTSFCGQTQGRLYNPSKANQTGVQFNISYLAGAVSGPIVWDQLNIGGYEIYNQALGAANNVEEEPLAYDFDGILGLALPLNSVIAQLIPPVTSNNPDGAALASNIFGMTPTTIAPAARFISLSLSRPSGGQVPSLLGIGQHPSQLISDPSTIDYSTVVTTESGDLYWKTQVRAITVYVNGSAKPVDIGHSISGAVFPTAVLDSGVPLILMTSTVADGIYGALGIGPADDGQYYVPCTEPLNMTITLDDRPETSLHPLDLTGQSDPSAEFCVGLIQSADKVLTNPTSPIGDMILGVPFLRNVYTVMGYEMPNANGSFTANSTSDPSDTGEIEPCLGLLGLTNATTALQEFHTVRVLKQPLSTNSTEPNPHPSSTTKKMSLGVDVLIALFSFFALCFLLFAVRFILLKRKYRQAAGGSFLSDLKGGLGAYRLARRGSSSSGDGDGLPSEDTLRTLRFEEYMKKERMQSQYTVSSGKTHVESDVLGDIEFGYRRKSQFEDSWDAQVALDWSGNTLAVINEVGDKPTVADCDHSTVAEHEPHVSSPLALSPSELSNAPAHDRTRSVSIPLLAHTREDSGNADDMAEFGVVNPEVSMAGVGTAARGSRIEPLTQHGSMDSTATMASLASASKSRARSRPSRTLTGPRPLSTQSSGTVSNQGS